MSTTTRRLQDRSPFTPSALSQAIVIWSTGRQISTVLAARLMAEGHDVQALERRHRP